MNSLSKLVGCKLPWDVWSSPNIQLCGTVEQLLEMVDLYEKIDTWEKHSVVNLTGCQPPCQYTEYKMKYAMKKGKTPGLILRLSESKVLTRTEKVIYPVESFISEFGGAMGLFLGFSFMMIWDLLVFVTLYILQTNSFSSYF